MKKTATLLLVLLTVVSLGAQAPVSDVPKLDIEKYTLANGLEVILSEDHRVPLVGIDVWYHVGPAHEAAGVARFLRWGAPARSGGAGTRGRTSCR